MDTVTLFLFFFLFSSVGTAFIIRPFLPVLTSIPWKPILLLDEWSLLHYETENYVFMTSVIVFFLLFVMGLILRPFLQKKIPGLVTFARRGVLAIVGVIVAQPFSQYLVPPTNITTFFLMGLWFIGILVIEKYVLWHPVSDSWTFGIVTILLIKVCIPVFFRMDTGVNPLILKSEYIAIIATLIVIIAIWFIAKHFRYDRRIQKMLSKRTIGVILFVFLALSLLRLMINTLPTMPKYDINYDMYTIVSPAYQLTKGATPFVNLMSQYGVLILCPWILWLTLFPGLPVSPDMSVIATTIIMIVYFACFLVVTGKIIKHRVIYILTVLSTFYYTFMVRSYVPKDTASLLSFPNGTPLRFGMFLIPLWALANYENTGMKKSFFWFLFLSVLYLFFSFELGVGWFASAIGVGVLFIAATKPALRVREGIRLTGILLWSLFMCIGGLIAITIIRTGKLPNMSIYMYFSKLFGASGLYMLPIYNEIAFWAPILITGIGGAFGIYLILIKNKRIGLVFAYLSLIQLTMMPYYVGRSLFQTLFVIMIPSVILSAMIVDVALSHLSYVRKNSAIAFIVLLFITFLYVNGWRTVYQGVLLWKLPLRQVREISGFIHKAFTVWPVLETPEYRFLKAHIPENCPLSSLDYAEYQLAPALKLPYALNFPTLRNLVMTQEEINSFDPFYHNGFYCLFINKKQFEGVSQYGIYEMYWLKVSNRARVIAEDPAQGFVLYAIYQK